MPFFKDTVGPYLFFVCLQLLQSWIITCGLAVSSTRLLLGKKVSVSTCTLVATVLYLLLIAPIYVVTYVEAVFIYRRLVATDYPGNVPDPTPVIVLFVLIVIGGLATLLISAYLEGKRRPTLTR
jgi:hypothetical protein